MDFSVEEIELLAKLHKSESANFEPTARLLTLRCEYTLEEIILIAEDADIGRQLQFRSFADEDLHISITDAYSELLTRIGAYDDASSKTALPPHLSFLIPGLVQFDEDFHFVDNEMEGDRRGFHDLTDQELHDELREPHWTPQKFAAFSLGKRRGVRSISTNGPLVTKFNNRLRLIEMAQELPADQEGHLPTICSPRTYVKWAVDGDRFTIYGPITDYLKLPSRQQLANDLAATKKQVEDLEEQLKSSPTHKHRLICMALVACINQWPRDNPRPLFNRDQERSRFFTGLIDKVEHFLGSLDKFSVDEARDYIRECYDGLSEETKRRWAASCLK